MNVQDVSAHWVALHEVLGLGAAIANEAEYLRVLASVDELVDATAGVDDHPLWGLIGLAGDRIREYEGRVHPWPDTSTPAAVLAGLMRQHGLRQWLATITLAGRVASRRNVTRRVVVVPGSVLNLR